MNINTNKNYVYIDFEAISNPFARVLSIPTNTPFAYSIAAKTKDDIFKVKTFIINFVKINSIKSLWSTLKQQIIKDIYEINSNLKIDEVIFIGHNPNLEKMILKKLFPKNNVEPLMGDKLNLSLSKLTGPIFKHEYFANTKKIIEDSNINILKKLSTKSNGLIASFIGFWLYVNSLTNLRSNDKRKKFFLKLNKHSLIKELRKYSKDDVNKMLFLASDPEGTNALVKRYLNKNELLRALRNIDFSDSLTIKEIKQKIWNL